MQGEPVEKTPGRRRWWLGSWAAPFVLTACNAIWGTSDLQYGPAEEEPPLLEDCTNHLDDDGDGAEDCADPDCAEGFVCMPAPPGAFSLVFALAGAPHGEPPCGDEVAPLELWGDYSPPDSACVCSCAQPSDASCSVAGLHAYQGPDCTGQDVAIGTGCRDVTNDLAISGSTILQAPGSCEPTAVLADDDLGELTTRWSLCHVPRIGGGCPPNQVCSPKGPAGYPPLPCLLAGPPPPISCPGPPFAMQIRLAADGTMVDDRTCNASGCSCGEVVGQRCEADSYWYSEANCTGTATAATLDGGCTTRPELAQSLEITGAHSQGGACTPAGAATREGEVAPAWTHLLCCPVP